VAGSLLKSGSGGTRVQVEASSGPQNATSTFSPQITRQIVSQASHQTAGASTRILPLSGWLSGQRSVLNNAYRSGSKCSTRCAAGAARLPTLAGEPVPGAQHSGSGCQSVRRRRRVAGTRPPRWQPRRRTRECTVSASAPGPRIAAFREGRPIGATPSRPGWRARRG
jgi:hypothetical protein